MLLWSGHNGFIERSGRIAMKKKKIFFIIVLILFVLYVLNYSYGKLLWKNALHFPDNERAVVTVKYYADNGSSLELDEEKKDILFDLIKKEAQFAGYSSQGKLSPIMEEDDVYSVIITGDDYFSLLYLSKNPEKTVICANNRYIKLGTMRQTKSFLQKLFD